MGYFIELIKKDVKQRLDEQVTHLKSLSEDQSYDQSIRSSKEWRLLYEGASTVIELLDNEIGRTENLNFILTGLDREQLKKIASLATSKIEAIESEPKIKIFGVCLDGMYYSWKRTFPEAKASLIETAISGVDIDHETDVMIEINEKLVFESELDEYLATK